MSRYVELHGTGRWNDSVGNSFNNAAIDAVNDFNRAAEAIYSHIAAVDAFNESDIEYTSQKEKIYAMRVEFNG